ncbi:MAG TPA: hypothetical protein VIR30_08460 [Nocardioides sp.]
MHLDHSATGGTLADVDNFRELDARIPRSTPPADVQDWLDGLGATRDDEHVWVPVRALSRMGRPSDPKGISQFDKMIAYADGAGWVRTDGDTKLVRAHVIEP